MMKWVMLGIFFLCMDQVIVVEKPKLISLDPYDTISLFFTPHVQEIIALW